jgi:hypothetical protein
MKPLLFTGLVVAVVLAASRADEKAKPAPAKDQQAAHDCCFEEQAVTTQRVFELRTYYTNEGKLDDLNKRFRDHTCGLLKKHGAELIGFWTPTDEKDGKGGKLVYLLAFPSREAAKKCWDEFGMDPKWRQVREESHKNGVLVKKVDSVFLEPTDYSALK